MNKTVAALLFLLVMCTSLTILISPLAAVITFFAVAITFYLSEKKDQQKDSKDSTPPQRMNSVVNSTYRTPLSIQLHPCSQAELPPISEADCRNAQVPLSPYSS